MLVAGIIVTLYCSWLLISRATISTKLFASTYQVLLHDELRSDNKSYLTLRRGFSINVAQRQYLSLYFQPFVPVD